MLICTKQKSKNDEFYIRYEDIENEVMKYCRSFKGKVVYLPCDDPAEKKSEFWTFFVDNFDAFGLKNLLPLIMKKMVSLIRFGLMEIPLIMDL